MAKKIKVEETLTVEKNPEMEVLESKFGWIRKEVPCFTMNGNDIRVILEPCDFYGTFKVNINLSCIQSLFQNHE